MEIRILCKDKREVDLTKTLIDSYLPTEKWFFGGPRTFVSSSITITDNRGFSGIGQLAIALIGTNIDFGISTNSVFCGSCSLHLTECRCNE